ncbi:MAG: hypothetical protein ACRC62_15290 [Microcoleus sp.]
MVRWINNGGDRYNVRATISWDTPYAQKVHAQRPWTDRAVNSVDIADLINRQNGTDFRANVTDGVELFGKRCDDILDNATWNMRGSGQKRYKAAPTGQTISDSEALKKSRRIVYRFR